MKTLHILKMLAIVAFIGWLAMILSGCPDDGEDSEPSTSEETLRTFPEDSTPVSNPSPPPPPRQIDDNRLERWSTPPYGSPGWDGPGKPCQDWNELPGECSEDNEFEVEK